MSLEDLSSSPIRWNGQDFLDDINFNCEITTETDYTTQDLPEVKSSLISLVIGNTDKSHIFHFSRFSQFNRIVRTVAFMLRFAYNIHNKNSPCRDTIISVDELKKAEITLGKLCQLESFPQEYKLL